MRAGTSRAAGQDQPGYSRPFPCGNEIASIVSGGSIGQRLQLIIFDDQCERIEAISVRWCPAFHRTRGPNPHTPNWITNSQEVLSCTVAGDLVATVDAYLRGSETKGINLIV